MQSLWVLSSFLMFLLEAKGNAVNQSVADTKIRMGQGIG